MKTELSNKARGVLRRMLRGRPEAAWGAEYASLSGDQRTLISGAVEQSLARELVEVDKSIHRLEAELLPDLRQQRASITAQLEVARRALGISV